MSPLSPSSFSTGLTGLNAAVERLDTAAASIARAAITTVDDSGNPAAVAAQAQPGAAEAATNETATVAPSEDLVSAIVEQISASSAFMANVQTIKASDENLEALLKLR
ncbi:MAG: hypothetical protein AB8C46_07755 [Burkholderiaceae bacterium]